MLGLRPIGANPLAGFIRPFGLVGYNKMLTIEDGTIVANANSFVSIADVVAHADLVGNTAFALATSAAQEQAIYRAMRWIKSLESRMKGCRVNEAQALSWPRYDVYAYGRIINSNIIPIELKEAVMEAALLEQATPDALQPSLEGNIKRLRKKLDGVGEKETEYFGAGKVGQINYPKIIGLIQPFLQNNQSWERW